MLALRPAELQQRPDAGQLVPRRRRVGRGPGAARPGASRPAPTRRPTSSCPTPRDVAAVTRALRRGVDGVAEVRAGQAPATTACCWHAVLDHDPYSTEAFDLIPRSARRRKRGGRRRTCSSAAPTAIEHDLREAATRDTLLIVPIALARRPAHPHRAAARARRAAAADRAPSSLSFAAALGVGAVVFDVVFGFPGSDPSLPLFAFVFLVALGIDYNIFLMARVREETLAHGTRERDAARAGRHRRGHHLGRDRARRHVRGARPCCRSSSSPRSASSIAFGVLLDTFIVRSVLVPALTFDIGPKIWWPSRAGGRPTASTRRREERGRARRGRARPGHAPARSQLPAAGSSPACRWRRRARCAAAVSLVRRGTASAELAARRAVHRRVRAAGAAAPARLGDRAVGAGDARHRVSRPSQERGRDAPTAASSRRPAAAADVILASGSRR